MINKVYATCPICGISGYDTMFDDILDRFVCRGCWLTRNHTIDTQLKNCLERELRNAESNYILHSANYVRHMNLPYNQSISMLNNLEDLREQAGKHFNNVLWFVTKAWLYR